MVGDTTIMASRCEYAEFTQPYSDSGLQVLVYTKSRTSAARAWLFKKPFTTWTWISTALINLYSGFVVWFIERRTNRDFEGSWFRQCGTIIWIAFTTLFTSLQGKLSYFPLLVKTTFSYKISTMNFHNRNWQVTNCIATCPGWLQ